ncbi:TMEM165/GDT1 family protein [Uliginosibacterium gangwonense]|uniref:TMEM165/GDT1 family protein n=1 Tax=Uliginosibacterium gangwonense TaxID=392736 RepID=UPI000363227A|nr:TMEM165/GDT1 family protein [Uliginosibacterium gangwonense]
MEAFLVSTGIVAFSEMGDKTQLLALVLAARLQKPIPICLGILAATLINHACAAAVGHWITVYLGADVMRWILGVSFLAMAGWMLIPDKLDEDEDPKPARFGAFLTTVIVFFLVEMGDKTQFATIALAAKYSSSLLAVVAGTTTGMMLADAPVVFFGDKLTRLVPIKVVHIVCAGIFALLGVLALLNVGALF